MRLTNVANLGAPLFDAATDFSLFTYHNLIHQLKVRNHMIRMPQMGDMLGGWGWGLVVLRQLGLGVGIHSRWERRVRDMLDPGGRVVGGGKEHGVSPTVVARVHHMHGFAEDCLRVCVINSIALRHATQRIIATTVGFVPMLSTPHERLPVPFQQSSTEPCSS